jgi:hypothetical protein
MEAKKVFGAVRSVTLATLVVGGLVVAGGCKSDKDNGAMAGDKKCSGDMKCGGDHKCGGDKKCGGDNKCGGDHKCGGDNKCGGGK